MAASVVLIQMWEMQLFLGILLSSCCQVQRYIPQNMNSKIIGVVKVKVSQLCPTPHDRMDYTVHGILQARILEWRVVLSSRGSCQPRDGNQVSHIAGRFYPS